MGSIAPFLIFFAAAAIAGVTRRSLRSMVRLATPLVGAANPYLLQAGILAAGLDGVAGKRDPGKRLDVNMYAQGRRLHRLRRLPLNLLDAIRLLDKSKIARAGLGDAFVTSYVKLKHDEWARYTANLSDWEIENTLDC